MCSSISLYKSLTISVTLHYFVDHLLYLGGYSGTWDVDLGKKVGNLDFWDGGGILELWIWT